MENNYPFTKYSTKKYYGKIISGEDLAVYAKKKLPKAKIIILTTFNDSHRINNILKIEILTHY